MGLTFRFIFSMTTTVVYAILLAGFGYLTATKTDKSDRWGAALMLLYLSTGLLEDLSIYVGSVHLVYEGWAYYVNLLLQLVTSFVYLKVIETMGRLTVSQAERWLAAGYFALLFLLALWRPARGVYHLLLYITFLWGVVRLFPLRRQSAHQRALFWVLTFIFLCQLANAVFLLSHALPQLDQRGLLQRQHQGLYSVVSLVELVAWGCHFGYRICQLRSKKAPTEAPFLTRVKELGIAHGLSARELEILELIAQGLTNREIAERTFTAEGTVKVHVYNIYKKFQVSRRAQLLATLTQPGEQSAS